MEMIKKIADAGIVGAGGAGFPTHIKYSVKTKHFILNAVECEPLIHSDKYLIRTRAKDIINTMIQIAQEIEASQLVIAIKKVYQEEIKFLQEAIGNHNISIFEMDSFYPAGDEQIIIYEVTGQRVPIGKLPKDIGVTVSNVGTICTIADAFNDKMNTHKILSVMGDVVTPSIINVPIGMNIQECLSHIGTLNKEFSVILGGPMMGKIYNDNNIQNLVITKTINSLIVLKKDHYLLQRQENPTQHMINQALSACIQCRQCTELCPRFLIGHPLHPHRVMRSIPYGNIQENPVFEESLLCCECGVCDYVCPMHLSPRRINQLVKKELSHKPRAPKEIRNPVAQRPYRKLATYRLINMIDIQQYKNQKPLQVMTLTTDTVCIPLKQHIGVPSIPVVTIGELVHDGTLIAQIPPQKLGANIHASITGTIREITDQYIIIKK